MGELGPTPIPWPEDVGTLIIPLASRSRGGGNSSQRSQSAIFRRNRKRYWSEKNQHMSTTNPASGVSVSPSVQWRQASQVVLVVKNLPTDARDVKDVGLIPGSIRSPRGPVW